MNSVCAYLEAHGFCWAFTRAGSLLVFDAPPDYCGVYVVSKPTGFGARLAERGWLVLYGPPNTVIAQITSAFARE